MTIWADLCHIDMTFLNVSMSSGSSYYTTNQSWKCWVGLFPCTLMSLARLSRELISRPSLQACKQEITFWVSMRPGRIVRPDRLPRKYWVNLGVPTSPPRARDRGEKHNQENGRSDIWEGKGQKWNKGEERCGKKVSLIDKDWECHNVRQFLLSHFPRSLPPCHLLTSILSSDTSVTPITKSHQFPPPLSHKYILLPGRRRNF